MNANLRPVFRNPLKKFRLLAVMLLALMATSTGMASASADIWVLNDSFEVTTPWNFDGNSPFGGSFMNDVARSGTKSARLETTANTWKSVGRRVSIVPAANNWDWISGGTCTPRFYVRSLTGSLNVRVEVIDPATWAYLSMSDVAISQGNYTEVYGANWNYKAKNEVFVRVSISGAQGEVAYVDDLRVTCAATIIH